MPKSKGSGGKKFKRSKKQSEGTKRELVFKTEDQEYAQVLKMLGNGRLEAFCFDGTKRMSLIRGKMRKKVWINQGDIILVSLRDYQDDKADVIYKYTPDECRQLKSLGEIPESAKLNETDNNQYENEDIIFSMEAGVQEEDRESDDDDLKSEDSGELDVDQI
mmetsp:Transcript_19318/g.21894  ORF Transcript_19318/g.21894 Transcript_19318/m.21894 type:complete len:162 (+) Transcript_19318:249-734(+)